MSANRRKTRRSWFLALMALVLLPLAAGLGLFAGTYVIDTDGHMFSVLIGTDPADPQLQGVQIQDRAPSGQVVSQFIPSALDAIVDAAPVVALRPLGGLIVVWARTEGPDSELALAVRDGSGSWRSHMLLTSDLQNDQEPRLLVDSQGVAQVLWWGNGPGGPIYLQGYDPESGDAVGPRYRPLDPPGTLNPKKSKIDPGTYDGAGGLDDPGVPTTGARATASAIPCGGNPLAVPDHGVIMSCGRPAAFQLTDCRLTVGVQLSSGSWTQTTSDLTSVDLLMNSPRELVQTLADAYCLN